MKGFDTNWLLSRQVREMLNGKSRPVPADAVAVEADLHEQIEAECRRRGWVSIHSRMDMPTTTACGVCDFIILADGGRLILCEAKSRTGKLSLAQQGFIHAAEKNGHAVHVVRSLGEFLERVK